MQAAPYALDGPPAAPRTARIHAKSLRGSVSGFNGPSKAFAGYRAIGLLPITGHYRK